MGMIANKYKTKKFYSVI